MRVLKGEEAEEAMKYLVFASNIAAKHSLCLRRKAAAIIVQDGRVIGEGVNIPPGGKRLEKCLKDELPPEFKSDRTCCIHAEQVAINNALRAGHGDLSGARLYFVRLQENGQNIERAGEPYCTGCSKEILFEGIAEVVLWHSKGICVYESGEYNNLSFRHGEWADKT